MDPSGGADDTDDVGTEGITEQMLAGLFGRAAATYDTVIPFFARFGRRLVALADLQPGERVLDVAAGRGALLFPAAEAVGPTGSVVAVDLAPEMVRELSDDIARRGVPNAEVGRMSATRLAFDDASFDVVLCGFGLHIFPDADVAAAEVDRVLRPGGRCAATSPGSSAPGWDFFGDVADAFAARFTGPLPPYPDPGFDLAGLLARAGLRTELATHLTERFRFSDRDDFWAWAWSQGMRGWLEALSEDDLAAFRVAIYERLAPLEGGDGFQFTQGAKVVVARRPAAAGNRILAGGLGSESESLAR